MRGLEASRQASCPMHRSTPATGVRSAPRRAPGPRGLRLLGSLLDVRQDPIRFVGRSTRSHGDMVAFRMGPRQLFLLAHPQHFRHVLCANPDNYVKGVGLQEAKPLLGRGLLTGGGRGHTARRRLFQRAFHGSKISDYSLAMERATSRLGDRWAAVEEAGGTVDVAQAMVALALEILGDTVLDLDLRSDSLAIAHDLDVLTQWAMARMTALVKLPLGVPIPANRRARAALQRLDTFARDTLRSRRQQLLDDCEGEEREDLVSLFLAADKEAGGDRRARDELLTFLLAGHETGAAVLSWTWYLLARHPQVEARLHRELAEELAGAPPTLDDLPRLTYTRAVLEEVMRLYPPVWMIPRRALDADVVGGFEIPAGAEVLLSVYSAHRHPDFWPDPERFDPDRFAQPGSASEAYMPFGAGPRVCLGSRLARIELLMVVASIAQRYRLRTVSDRPREAEALLTLRPRAGMPMTLRRRDGGTHANRSASP